MATYFRGSPVPESSSALRLLRCNRNADRKLHAELFSRPVRLLDSEDKDPVLHPSRELHFRLLAEPDSRRRFTHAHLQVPAYLRDRQGPLVHPPPRKYKPCSFRQQSNLLPRWVRHCHHVQLRRQWMRKDEEKQQCVLALAFLVRLVLKHWSKYVRVQRRLRPRLLRILRRAELRGAWWKWARLVACERMKAIANRQLRQQALDRWRLRVGLLRERELALRRAHDAVHDRYRRRMRALYWRNWRDRLHLERLRYRAKVAIFKLLRYGATGKLRDGFLRWIAYVKMLAEIATARRLAGKAGRECAERVRMRRFARRLRNVLYRSLLRRGWLRLARKDVEAPPYGSSYCSCVAEVLRYGRCSCSPAAHLLRRLENLHKLVEHVDAEHAVSKHRRLPILTEGKSVAWENRTLSGGLPEWDPRRSYVYEYVKRTPFERGLNSVLRASGELPSRALVQEGTPIEELDEEFEASILQQAAEIEARKKVGRTVEVQSPADSDTLLKTHVRRRGKLSKWEVR